MRARLWEDPQGRCAFWVTGVGLKVGLRMSDFIHTSPHCVCGGRGIQTVVLSAGWDQVESTALPWAPCLAGLTHAACGAAIPPWA